MNAPSNAPSICHPHTSDAMHGRTDGRTYADASSPRADTSSSVTRALAYGDSPFPQTQRNDDEPSRGCAHCGKPLTRRQKSTCSTACSRLKTAAEQLRRRADFVEDVEFLLEQGVTAWDIASRLGVSPAAAVQRLIREGRADLAQPFERIRAQERTGACSDCGTPITRGSSRCQKCAYRVGARKRAAKRWGRPTDTTQPDSLTA